MDFPGKVKLITELLGNCIAKKCSEPQYRDRLPYSSSPYIIKLPSRIFSHAEDNETKSFVIALVNGAMRESGFITESFSDIAELTTCDCYARLELDNDGVVRLWANSNGLAALSGVRFGQVTSAIDRTATRIKKNSERPLTH